MRLARIAPLAALLLIAAAVGARSGTSGPTKRVSCPVKGTSSAYAARVAAVLRSGRDVLGNALLRAPGGPSYTAAHRALRPLLLARGPSGTPLTDSGVYYLAFAQPSGPQGAGSVALHVADGGQIVSQKVGGRSLTVDVGAGGGERYGSCLERLGAIRLGGGSLPILDTSYADADGTRYAQESFATTLPGSQTLASFVRLTVDARHAKRPPEVRLRPSVNGLRRRGDVLVHGRTAYLAVGGGGRFDGSAVDYAVPRGGVRTIYAVWLDVPSAVSVATPDAESYAAARQATAAYWRKRLAEGSSISVPEPRVENALRALRIQDLMLTWRYSIGNPYEEFSFPESVDVAQVLAEQGFFAEARSILRVSLTRAPNPYPNWKRGERLLASAEYVRLSGDRVYLAQATPTLRSWVAALRRQIDSGPTGLLDRERYSSDIPNAVLGLHSQAVVWAGLRAMSQVWSAGGQTALAETCTRLADRLGAGLRRAVARSEARLPDGSLFVGAQLLDGERPYDTLTEARLGSYWNLVMPYALASGLFPAGGRQAAGILDYMLLHGSRLLGLVRAGGYALYGQDPPPPTSATDEVYGINVARFLADNDQPDQLVLSLYGDLGAGMTANTFVSGEAASLTPLPGTTYRAMYLPPNGASNAAFLETLRLMLVHETTDSQGRPHGLQLAYSTPRGWLAAGKRIAVEKAPTSFGPVSFSIAATAHGARATLDVPDQQRPATLTLRLRLPAGRRVLSAALGGKPVPVDRTTGTLDLTGRTGTLDLVVRTT